MENQGLGNKIGKGLGTFIKEGGKVVADLAQSTAKGAIKGAVNTVDLAGDALAIGADVLTGIPASMIGIEGTNLSGGEGLLDKATKKFNEFADKKDDIDSALDKTKAGKVVLDIAELAGSLGTFGLGGKLLGVGKIISKGGKYFKVFQGGKEVEVSSNAVKEGIKNAKKVKEVTNEISKSGVLKTLLDNKKKTIAGAGLVGAGTLVGLSGDDSDLKTLGGSTNQVSDGVSIYTGDENKKEEVKDQVLNDTKEINSIVKTIRQKYESGEISKKDAKDALITVNKYADSHFDTSISDNLFSKGIDGTFGNREKLAKSLGIDGYKGSYSQNVTLLNKVKYMSGDEINNLIGK